ncbi:MAG: polysaccharide biosynthesis C-terminal domain-containing protein [Tannerellaceae bacterium]|nr:polysaccharide biosynthesis C-terminal domain-containing protein [Tannerellaceae bacterium]
MEKNKELAKNTAIISFGKLCTQFLSFLLLPFYTAILSTEEYGTVDLLITYQQLIGYIAFFQIEQALFRYMIDVRGENKETSEIVSSCFAFAFGQSAVLCLVMAVFTAISNVQYMGYLCIYVIAVIFSQLFLQSARGFGKNQWYAAGSFISAVSIIVFNILFLAVFKMGITGMLTSYILGNSLCSLVLFFALKMYRYLNLKFIHLDMIKKCLAYSLPLVPNVLSWWIISVSDRTIVAVFLGTAYNGLLTVAHKFPSAYSAFYTIFNLSWTESAALHINDSDAKPFFANVIDRVYRLFSVVAIGIIACLPFVFNLLVNKNYSDSYYQIPIYMAASLCQVFQGMYSVIYIALKKTKEVAKSTIASAILNVSVHLLLINTIGLYAASISTLFSYLFLCIWRYFDLKKYLCVHFDKRLLFSSITVLIIVCIGYYSQIFAIEIICLILAILYAVILNKDIILLIIKSPRNFKDVLTGKKE